ncbi:MAG: hypothetical protein R3293_06030 [Candidatus Promineifilaceae bacterium]|nr:hypothetical protein [Candidatus Promineifilaceae bacterium]
MIETDTVWKDSGFDCDHCGGEILKRTDRETGQADFVCYQCRECGCQWTLNGDVLRIGSGQFCKAAQTQRERQRQDEPGSLPDILVNVDQWAGLLSKSLWVLLALIAGVILLRFGGGVVARYLLPIVVIGVAAFLLVRYGKTQSWW